MFCPLMEHETILEVWDKAEFSRMVIKLKVRNIFHNRNLTLRHRISLEMWDYLDNLITCLSLLDHRVDSLCMKIAQLLETRLTTALTEPTPTARIEITEKYLNLKSTTTQKTHLILIKWIIWHLVVPGNQLARGRWRKNNLLSNISQLLKQPQLGISSSKLNKSDRGNKSRDGIMTASNHRPGQ